MRRAVRVPPGESLVTFDYAPSRLYWGIGVSAATLLALAATAIRRPHSAT